MGFGETKQTKEETDQIMGLLQERDEVEQIIQASREIEEAVEKRDRLVSEDIFAEIDEQVLYSKPEVVLARPRFEDEEV